MSDAVDIAYMERNRVALLAAALARYLGMRAGVYIDPEESDPQYSTVLQIDLPTGQVSFHLDLSDREWTIFSPAWGMIRDYDGHDLETKWRRIDDFVHRYGVRSRDDVVIAAFRETIDNFEAQIKILRTQNQSLAKRFQDQRARRQRSDFVVESILRLAANTPELAAVLTEAEKLADDAMRAMSAAETQT